MPVPASVIAASTISWNSLTWSAATSPGGPIRVRADWNFDEAEEFTGADIYTQQLFLTRGRLIVRVALREGPVPTPGTRSNMTVTFKTKSSTRNRVFAGLVFKGIGLSSDKNSLGEEELIFQHESADGTADPYS